MPNLLNVEKSVTGKTVNRKSSGFQYGTTVEFIFFEFDFIMANVNFYIYDAKKCESKVKANKNWKRLYVESNMKSAKNMSFINFIFKKLILIFPSKLRDSY